ncbi:KxYKxGKxW signal peptide domain-containing protein [Lentilactobacillus curieae]|nr:KxYKxGKxW signal peptide domain-containing protein [Lentilactobacillus curieae]
MKEKLKNTNKTVRYRLYKAGKLWVIGGSCVIGMGILGCSSALAESSTETAKTSSSVPVYTPANPDPKPAKPVAPKQTTKSPATVVKQQPAAQQATTATKPAANPVQSYQSAPQQNTQPKSSQSVAKPAVTQSQPRSQVKPQVSQAETAPQTQVDNQQVTQGQETKSQAAKASPTAEVEKPATQNSTVKKQTSQMKAQSPVAAKASTKADKEVIDPNEVKEENTSEYKRKFYEVMEDGKQVFYEQINDSFVKITDQEFLDQIQETIDKKIAKRHYLTKEQLKELPAGTEFSGDYRIYHFIDKVPEGFEGDTIEGKVMEFTKPGEDGANPVYVVKRKVNGEIRYFKKVDGQFTEDVTEKVKSIINTEKLVDRYLKAVNDGGLTEEEIKDKLEKQSKVAI